MPRGKKRSNVIESKMKIIILHGKHNSGKTTTFNDLYEKLLANGAIITNPKKELPAKDDFECIINYKGKKVALFSLGDYMFAIGSAVGYYTKVECDILAIAHSMKTPIHKNALFKQRKYDYAIINKEFDGVYMKDEDAVEKIIAEIENYTLK